MYVPLWMAIIQVKHLKSQTAHDILPGQYHKQCIFTMPQEYQLKKCTLIMTLLKYKALSPHPTVTAHQMITFQEVINIKSAVPL